MKQRSYSMVIITLTLSFFMLAAVSTGFSADKKATEKNAVKTVEKIAVKTIEKKTPEKAVTVNDTMISYKDFERRLSYYMQRLNKQEPLSEEMQANIRSDVLDDLINQELLFQESGKQGIKVTDAELVTHMASMKKNAGSPEQFDSLLKKMGYSESEYKTDLLRQTAIRNYIEKGIASTVTVTDAEAKTFFDANPDKFKVQERVRASHILFKLESDADDKKKSEERKKLLALKKRIEKGEDFATLAKENSQCPSSKQGGDLNYFTKGRMAKPFEDAAFSLKTGQVSDVVETQFGYHLIKVVDHKDAGVMDFEDVKDKLIEELRKQAMQKKIMAQVTSLREAAKIEKHIK